MAKQRMTDTIRANIRAWAGEHIVCPTEQRALEDAHRDLRVAVQAVVRDRVSEADYAILARHGCFVRDVCISYESARHAPKQHVPLSGESLLYGYKVRPLFTVPDTDQVALPMSWCVVQNNGLWWCDVNKIGTPDVLRTYTDYMQIREEHTLAYNGSVTVVMQAARAAKSVEAFLDVFPAALPSVEKYLEKKQLPAVINENLRAKLAKIHVEHDDGAAAP